MKKVTVEKKKQAIPTYVPKAAHELPMFFENKPYQGASGRIYPIPYSDGITDTKTDVDYDVYTIENEYVKTQVVPALGGKILRGLDKVSNYDFIYYNGTLDYVVVPYRAQTVDSDGSTYIRVIAIGELGSDGKVRRMKLTGNNYVDTKYLHL